MKNPEFWVKEAASIMWKEKSFSFQRAIQLSLGVSKEVDPQSGMTVNLMDVRRLFDQIRQQLSGQSFDSYSDVLKQALIAVKSDFLVGIQLEAINGIWRISANGIIEEQKSLAVLVHVDTQIYEGELSLWKKPNAEVKAEISHPTTLEELRVIPGAKLFVEAKQQSWLF